jgi:hypothetical protein
MSKPEQEQRDTSTFFQKPQFNAYERLICSHLIAAGGSEQPLQTVIHTCLAALALDEATSLKLEINRTQAENLYTVAQRLETAIQDKDHSDTLIVKVELLTLNFKTTVAPWTRLQGYRHFVDRESSPEEQEEYIKKYPQHYFHNACQTLTPSGFQNMKSDFLLYAIPVVQTLSRKLSTLISPETFVELLKIYHNEKVAQS